MSDMLEYQNFELESISAFRELLQKNSSLCGLNVTIPYKEKVIPFLDELTDEAKEIGAVNTVAVTRNNSGIKTTGYNTDVTGFYKTIKPLLKSHHSGALVLGTGGASKAVVYVFEKLQMPVLKVSRNKCTEAISYDEITRDHIIQYPVIINTTPLGTFPDIDRFPELPYTLLSANNLLYDLVYNPEMTEFLLKGQQQGATTLNGYTMLIAQAEASWEIWQRTCNPESVV